MIPKHAQEHLDWIKKLGYKPKCKEAGFLRDVKDYIERDMRLTPPMAKWIKGIYDKASGGGQYQDRDF